MREFTIHVTGRGLYVVARGQELLRGTFEQSYNYVNAAHQGPHQGLAC
jgi:hypothetical protein